MTTPNQLLAALALTAAMDYQLPRAPARTLHGSHGRANPEKKRRRKAQRDARRRNR